LHAVTALVFTEKLGVLPERIFESMFNDRLVAKGTILAMVTEIFKQYMAITDGNVEDLVTLLTKGKVANRLLDYFPPGQQTEAAFKSHFEKEGLDKLVRSKRHCICSLCASLHHSYDCGTSALNLVSECFHTCLSTTQCAESVYMGL
jgi:hypothetical protein